MFKSIFSKQLAAYLVSILVAFAILAVGLNYMLQNFFVNQAADTLVRQGQRIAASYAHMEGLAGQQIRHGHGQMGMRRNQALAQFQNDMRTLETLGASAFVVSYFDGQLEGVIATGDIRQILLDEEMLRVFNGEIVILPVAAGELFDIAMLTVGYPIIVDGALWGAIFMNSPMDDIQAASSAAMRLVLLALALSLIVSFVLVLVTSRSMSRRITAIGRAAKEIAGGGFGRRIGVEAGAGAKDEIGQLAQSFNHMAQSLDNTEKTRREFIANISHDLRSPLTSMQGFLAAMMDGTIDEAHRQKYLDIVLTETKRLSALANDILVLTKIQGADDGLHTTQFDINELLRQSVILFEAQITAAGLGISADFAEERAIVAADKEKISRVVHNLIENAVKFTPVGEIRLSTKAKNGKIHIEIADTGIGMDAAAQNHIFDRFYKADISRGAHSGSGLGLSIVKEMLAAHGEHIGVESAPGEGSVFSFSLKQ
ncbi:MAG: HAMP domain-containing histidine kinase [Clostridiales bacterium]|jgi:signal transduction histidine kinase|nr:HAMP domain-containing histidine kinase [Clostridiales bacterium]